MKNPKFTAGDAVEVVKDVPAFGSSSIKGSKGFVEGYLQAHINPVKVSLLPEGRLIYLSEDEISLTELEIEDYVEYINKLTTKVLEHKNEATRLRDVYRHVDYQKRQILRRSPKYGIKVK